MTIQPVTSSKTDRPTDIPAVLRRTASQARAIGDHAAARLAEHLAAGWTARQDGPEVASDRRLTDWLMGRAA